MKKKPKKGAKPDAKPQTKQEPVDSFFNFFSPPQVCGHGLCGVRFVLCVLFVCGLRVLAEDGSTVEDCSTVESPSRGWHRIRVLTHTPSVCAPLSNTHTHTHHHHHHTCTPQVPQEDDDELEGDEMEALHDEIESDYDMGDAIRSKLIPHAVAW